MRAAYETLAAMFLSTIRSRTNYINARLATFFPGLID